jgi:hypothetical protein
MNLDEIREFLLTSNENSDITNIAKELLNLLDHKQNAWMLLRKDRNAWKTRCENILTLQRYDLEQYESAVIEADEGEFIMFESVENTIKDL